MLNKIIKFSFALVGIITGFTLTRSFFSIQNITIDANLRLIVFCAASIITAAVFYSTGNIFVEVVIRIVSRLEHAIQNMTLYELTIGAVGLIIGLVVANLVTIPIYRINIIGVPVAILANVLFGCIGIIIASGKKNEHILDHFKPKNAANTVNNAQAEPKLLDTSIIIDGRIVDICRAGFMEGELIIPGFVLEELRHIADSPDSLKRNRGRRGLDVLGMIQKDVKYPVRIENFEFETDAEVDDKLLIAAKKLGAKVMTVDYNLSKVANFQGIPVLNINELANAMKPIALPGEEMLVQVIKDGKETGQGVGYLDDGTMIVVEGGRRHMGETVSVTVTSVLQTAAGRLIFAKPKCQIERVV